jgi:hypothetical protein
MPRRYVELVAPYPLTHLTPSQAWNSHHSG